VEETEQKIEDKKTGRTGTTDRPQRKGKRGKKCDKGTDDELTGNVREAGKKKAIDLTGKGKEGEGSTLATRSVERTEQERSHNQGNNTAVEGSQERMANGKEGRGLKVMAVIQGRTTGKNQEKKPELGGENSVRGTQGSMFRKKEGRKVGSTVPSGKKEKKIEKEGRGNGENMAVRLNKEKRRN